MDRKINPWIRQAAIPPTTAGQAKMAQGITIMKNKNITAIGIQKRSVLLGRFFPVKVFTNCSKIKVAKNTGKKWLAQISPRREKMREPKQLTITKATTNRSVRTMIGFLNMLPPGLMVKELRIVLSYFKSVILSRYGRINRKNSKRQRRPRR